MFVLLFLIARCVGRLPPTFDMLMNEHTHAFYGKFATIKGMNPLPTRQGAAGRGGARDGRTRSSQRAHNRQSRPATAKNTGAAPGAAGTSSTGKEQPPTAPK